MLCCKCGTRKDAQTWMGSVSKAPWIPIGNSATLLIDVDPKKFQGKTSASIKLQATRVSTKRDWYSLFLYDQKGGWVYFWGFMDGKQVETLKPIGGFYELTHASIRHMNGNKRPSWMPPLDQCGLQGVQWRAPWVLTARKPTAVPDDDSDDSSSSSEDEDGKETKQRKPPVHAEAVDDGEAEAISTEFTNNSEEQKDDDKEEEETIGKRRNKKRKRTASDVNEDDEVASSASPVKRSRLRKLDETTEEEEKRPEGEAGVLPTEETTTTAAEEEEQPTWEQVILPIAQKHIPDASVAQTVSFRQFLDLAAQEVGWTEEYVTESKESIKFVLHMHLAAIGATAAEETTPPAVDESSVPMEDAQPAVAEDVVPIEQNLQQMDISGPAVVVQPGDGKETKAAIEQLPPEEEKKTTVPPIDNNNTSTSSSSLSLEIPFDQEMELLDVLQTEEWKRVTSSSSSSSSSSESSKRPKEYIPPPKVPVKLDLINYIGTNDNVESKASQQQQLPCPLYDTPPPKNSNVTMTDIVHAVKMRSRVIQFKDYNTSDAEFMQFLTLATPKARSLDAISFGVALGAMCTIPDTDIDRHEMLALWFDLECRLFKERLQRKVRTNPLKLLEQFSAQVKRPVLGISIGACLYEYTIENGLQPTGHCYPADSPQYLKMKTLDEGRQDFERVRLRLSDICSEFMHETVMHEGIAYVPVSFLESRLRHLFKQSLNDTVVKYQDSMREKYIKTGKKMPPGGTSNERGRVIYATWRAEIKKIIDASRPVRMEDNKLAEKNMKAGIKELMQETYLKFDQRRALLKWAIHIGMQDPVHWCMTKVLSAMIRRKHGADAPKEIKKKHNELVRFLPPKLRASAKRIQ